MTTIAMIAQKGGVGKTTLAVHWAIAADLAGMGPVAVIDTDPQLTAVKWAERRGRGLGIDSPLVVRANKAALKQHDVTLARMLKLVRNQGVKTILIDTPPGLLDDPPAGYIDPAVEAAKVTNFVAIPCQPTIGAIEALGPTVKIVNETGAPAAILLNQARHAGRGGSPINEAGLRLLASYGLPLCNVKIFNRAAMADAFIHGKSVHEMGAKGVDAKIEVNRTWAWIVQQMEGTQDGQQRCRRTG